MWSSSRRRTATAVAVSGQVATPSADEVSGATSPPKTRPYQVWTAAWFLASQGTPGRRARRACSISASRAESRRAESKKARSTSRGGAGSGRPWRWSQTRSRRTPRRPASRAGRRRGRHGAPRAARGSSGPGARGGPAGRSLGGHQDPEDRVDDDLAAGDDDQGDDEQDPHHRRGDAEPAGEPGADTAQDAALAWPDE